MREITKHSNNWNSTSSSSHQWMVTLQLYCMVLILIGITLPQDSFANMPSRGIGRINLEKILLSEDVSSLSWWNGMNMDTISTHPNQIHHVVSKWVASCTTKTTTSLGSMLWVVSFITIKVIYTCTYLKIYTFLFSMTRDGMIGRRVRESNTHLLDL